MRIDHRKGGIVFALAVGLLVAFASYRWITDPEPRIERQLEEQAVAAARDHLLAAVGVAGLEVVDPLMPDRRVGKTYVYRSGDGWEVSGHYRRGPSDDWHPYLLSLDASLDMTGLRIRDAGLRDREYPLLEVLP